MVAKVRLALGQSKELLIQIDSGELPLAEPLRSTYRGYALLAMNQADSAVGRVQHGSAKGSGHDGGADGTGQRAFRPGSDG